MTTLTSERALVAAQPVRNHIAWLRFRGHSDYVIAALAEVNRSAIAIIMTGKGNGLQLPHRIDAGMAARILALRPTEADVRRLEDA